jgi:predicted transcriptional regulator
MTVLDVLNIYLLEKRITRKAFCKKAGIDTSTLRRFMSGKDVFSENWVKIVKALDYEIHLKPKSHNSGTPNNGSGVPQSKANPVSEN